MNSKDSIESKKGVIAMTLELERRSSMEAENGESWRRSFFVSLQLALSLGVYSLLGFSSFLFVWIPLRYSRFRKFWNVDMEAKEPVFYETHTFLENQSSRFFTYDFPTTVFFPIVFGVYLGATRKNLAFSIASTIPGFVIFKSVQWTFGSAHVLTMVTTTFPTLGYIFFMKRALVNGRKSRIPWYAVIQYSCIIFGIILSLTIWSLPKNGTIQVLTVFVGFPLMREFNFAICRSSSKRLTLKIDAGVKKPVNRSVTWFFFFWVQLVWALVLRVYFSTISNPVVFRIVLIGQSVLEVVVRLSMCWRIEKYDMISKKWRNTVKKMPRQSSVMVIPFDERILTTSLALSKVRPSPTSSHKPYQSGSHEPRSGVESSTTLHRIAATHVDETLSIRTYHSMWIVMEALAELIAITTVPFVILIFGNQRLQLPLSYYSNLPEEIRFLKLDVAPVIVSMVLQLVAELLVDAFCFTFERRRGLSLVEIWKTRPRAFVVLVVLSLWFSNAVISASLSTGDSFTRCYDQDMCCCAQGRGLSARGLRQSYCEYRFDQNTTNLLAFIQSTCKDRNPLT